MHDDEDSECNPNEGWDYQKQSSEKVRTHNDNTVQNPTSRLPTPVSQSVVNRLLVTVGQRP